MLASTQKAPAVTVNGADYNSLRQDLKVNHTHDGVDGAKVDHTDLTSIGTKTHDQIDADIGTLYASIAGGIPWSKVQIGRIAVSDATYIAGGASRVTFPTPFTRTPIVIANIVMDGSNDLDKLAIFIVVYNVTTTAFDLSVLHPGLDGNSPGQYPFELGPGWPNHTQAKIHYIAMEPPA